MPPAPFAGVVHSVFHRACNVDLAGAGLLTLLDVSSAAVPHGIRLATPAEFDFRRHVSPRERVAGRGSLIEFASGGLLVDARHAATVCTSVDRIALDMENGETRAAWQAAWSAMADAARPESLGAILSSASRSVLTALLLDKARRSISALMRSTRSFDHDVATSAAVAAIGMGPGLTPAWDDFLVGYLSSLRTTALGRSERWRFITALGDAVRAAATATTLISRVQLEHAAHGQVSERLIEMLQAIADGDAGRTGGATARVLQLGSTSGTDTALGALCGAAAWASKNSDALPVQALLSTAERTSRRIGQHRRAPTGSHVHAAR